MSQILIDFLLFQAIYAVLEQMDRTFSAHGSLSLVSGVMVCFGLYNVVTLQYTIAPNGRYSRAGVSQCLQGSPGSCRSYLLCCASEDLPGTLWQLP